MKPKLLDLFCGAGGCSVGYERAGFECVGVDFIDQPIYPYKFIKADALEILAQTDFLAQFDIIHASPPCQGYSKITPKSIKADKPDLLGAVRTLLINSGKPFVIENVATKDTKKAGLQANLILLATLFPDLRVLRERHFELSKHIKNYCPQPALPKPVGSVISGDYLTCAGSGYCRAEMHKYKGKLKDFLHLTLFQNREIAMGINWICEGKLIDRMKQLNNAIPPQYTQYIGDNIIRYFNQIPEPQPAYKKQFLLL